MSDKSKWKIITVIFRLKTPLHIGYTPFKGSVVSPTRYYIPGRNLWGAITKRITEYLYKDPIKECRTNNKETCYQQIGELVMNNFRFSYFYLYDGRTIYFPRYTDEGLKYGDNKKEITKSEFEHRFIGSLISTAINNTGTAKDESLHEIEFINNRFKDENENLKDMKITGCIWIKKDAKLNNKEVIINDHGTFIDDFNVIRELILGGESKYGFGHVVLDSVNKIDFPVEWEDSEEIKIKVNNDEYLVAHLKYDKNLKFTGDIELSTGRGYFDPEKNENDKSKNNNNNSDSNNNNLTPGRIILKPKYYLSPGSTVILEGKNSLKLKVNWDGTLEVL